MKFNKSIFNLSAWVTLIISYILPYKITDGFSAKFGFPCPFLTIYIHSFSSSMSMLRTAHLNVFALILDIIIVYLIIFHGKSMLDKLKSTIISKEN